MLATPERASDEVNLARWHTERVLIGQGRGGGGLWVGGGSGGFGVGVGHNVVFSHAKFGIKGTFKNSQNVFIHSFVHSFSS